MLNRFDGNVVPFASEATLTNRTVFGAETQSDDIDDNLNADFKKGWEIVGLNDNPTREDFNAMGYTLGNLISYLYQNGVAEWNDKQEYKINSIAIGTDGNIYQSLVDSNIGNALTDTTKWVCIASKNSIVNSIAELKTISNIESINVLGYYSKGDGGGGLFYWDSTSTEADNGGTVIQATGVTTGRWKRVFSGAVNVKWFGANVNETATNNTIFIQSAVNSVLVGGSLIIDKPYNISSTINIPQRIKIKTPKEFNGGGLYGDIDGALLSKSGQMWLNDFEGLTLTNTSSSANASCIRGTMYRCSVKSCVFTCPNGKALNLLGNDYCVENVIEKNYFTGCKYGIYAESNTNNNTDSFILDNYFWSGTGISTTIENSIYWDTPSGCTFRGNHTYGGSQSGMIRLVAGINVSILDNYFEKSNNCRLRIDSGNPSSYTITGNKFWGGDGTTSDIDGDISSIIKLSFNPSNRAIFAFTGNIFEGGLNNVVIFSLLNGNDTDSHSIKISFDTSNMIGGAYALAKNAASGTSTLAERGVIESNHPEFFYFSTSQSLSPISVVCSEFFQKASGFATGFPSLPTAKAWLTNRQIKIHNISTNMTMSFSTGAAGGITGNKATDVAKIFAGDSAVLMLVDGNYFFMHDRS